LIRMCPGAVSCRCANDYADKHADEEQPAYFTLPFRLPFMNPAPPITSSYTFSPSLPFIEVTKL
jgi:hypothetical protein